MLLSTSHHNDWYEPKLIKEFLESVESWMNENPSLLDEKLNETSAEAKVKIYMKAEVKNPESELNRFK